MIKSLLFPLLLIGIAVGITFVYAIPEYGVLKQRQAELAAYNDALAQGQEILDLKSKLEAQYQAFTAEDRSKLQKLLPDSQDVIGSIVEMGDIASANGVMLTAVTDEPPAPPTETPTSFSSVDTTYKVIGDYENFSTFLKSLERSLRITDLNKLSFSTEKDGASDLMDFTLGATTYWLSE